MPVTFPNESTDYRTARDELLEMELELRRLTETVAEKPAYRRAFEKRRTILPADGYYEWYPTDQLTRACKPRKQPYFIRPADKGLLAMAGLYEIWRDPEKADDDPTRFLWTCTVLTTTPGSTRVRPTRMRCSACSSRPRRGGSRRSRSRRWSPT